MAGKQTFSMKITAVGGTFTVNPIRDPSFAYLHLYGELSDEYDPLFIVTGENGEVSIQMEVPIRRDFVDLQNMYSNIKRASEISDKMFLLSNYVFLRKYLWVYWFFRSYIGFYKRMVTVGDIKVELQYRKIKE